MEVIKQICLNKIRLRDFRNYESYEKDFDQQVTWITGPNGSGKTNLMEAIYLLATGKSRRVRKHEELIRWGGSAARVEGEIDIIQKAKSKEQKNENYNFQIATSSNQLEFVVDDLNARNDGFLTAQNDKNWVLSRCGSQTPVSTEESEINANVDLLEILITRGEVMGRKVAGKQFKVNGVNRQLRKFVGYLPAVWFGPEDLELVVGSGSNRRQYLNDAIGQCNSEYVRALTDYEKALKRRNKLLGLLSEGKVGRSAFGYFDQVLINSGKYLQQMRRQMVGSVNEWLSSDNFFDRLRIVYDLSEMSEGRLAKYEREEVQAGMTLVGPQRDDLILEFDFGTDNWQRLDRFGSRGQARMGALGLKLAELEFMADKLEARPILLLDDVFSELDEVNRGVVQEVIGKQQTVVTGVEEWV